MGDFVDNVSKKQEKKQEKQQVVVNRQLTQDFTHSMKPEQALEQNVKKQNTMNFEQLNFENFAEKKESELPIQEQNFDMLSMSKFAVKQENEENISGNQEANVEKEDREMKSITALKGLLSTIRDKKYGTSDDKGTWYIIQSSGEAFLNNIENKSDQERGVELAELLKSAQRYLGTHKGYRFTKKGRDRVAFAQSIVKSVSDIMQGFTMEGRVLAVDAILEKQNEVSQPGEAEAKELNKQFFADLAKETLKNKIEVGKDETDYITDKTYMIMHSKEKNDCFSKSADKITGGAMSKSIYQRLYSANLFGKNVLLNRNGDVRPEDANDAKLTEINIKRIKTCEPEEAPYIGRSAFLKSLEQIKITPDMLTREYLDNHYAELRHFANVLISVQNCYTDWGGRGIKHGELAEKEYRSLPDSIQKKLDAISAVGQWISDYMNRLEIINCYHHNNGEFRKDIAQSLKIVKERGIIEKLDKIKDEEKKWAEIQRLAESEYTDVLGELYEKVDLGNGKFKVMGVLDARLLQIKAEYEKHKDNMEFTEEDLKTIRYFSYSEEAQKESKRQGIDITPEAVAYQKLRKFEVDYKKQEGNKPENKELKVILEQGKFDRVYVQKIRYINYNKDGEPTTEEDKKNLEWNRAYAKSITENKQEDRVRLLKENCEFTAELINRVDFDRILDYDYWINNKDLFINLNNFSLNGMALDTNCIHKEDIPIMKEFFNNKTPMMKLLDDFFDAYRFMYYTVISQLEPKMGVKANGEYYKDIESDFNAAGSTDEIMKGPMVSMLKEMFAKAKQSNIAYIASKNK